MHLPAAWYKAAVYLNLLSHKKNGGIALSIHCRVTWTIRQCYFSSEKITGKVSINRSQWRWNFALKRNAEDYLERMLPIDVALDKLQQSRCTLSQAAGIWSELKTKLTPLLSTADRKKFVACKSTSLTDAHYLAYILDPKVNGNTLDAEHVDNICRLVLIHMSHKILAMTAWWKHINSTQQLNSAWK